jgi:hypothetical protein
MQGTALGLGRLRDRFGTLHRPERLQEPRRRRWPRGNADVIVDVEIRATTEDLFFAAPGKRGLVTRLKAMRRRPSSDTSHAQSSSNFKALNFFTSTPTDPS